MVVVPSLRLYAALHTHWPAQPLFQALDHKRDLPPITIFGPLDLGPIPSYPIGVTLVGRAGCPSLAPALRCLGFLYLILLFSVQLYAM
jgi:hypothetical protein